MVRGRFFQDFYRLYRVTLMIRFSSVLADLERDAVMVSKGFPYRTFKSRSKCKWSS